MAKSKQNNQNTQVSTMTVYKEIRRIFIQVFRINFLLFLPFTAYTTLAFLLDIGRDVTLDMTWIHNLVNFVLNLFGISMEFGAGGTVQFVSLIQASAGVALVGTILLLLALNSPDEDSIYQRIAILTIVLLAFTGSATLAVIAPDSRGSAYLLNLVTEVFGVLTLLYILSHHWMPLWSVPFFALIIALLSDQLSGYWGDLFLNFSTELLGALIAIIFIERYSDGAFQQNLEKKFGTGFSASGNTIGFGKITVLLGRLIIYLVAIASSIMVNTIAVFIVAVIVGLIIYFVAWLITALVANIWFFILGFI